jgi:hypothetical protein
LSSLPTGHHKSTFTTTPLTRYYTGHLINHNFEVICNWWFMTVASIFTCSDKSLPEDNLCHVLTLGEIPQLKVMSDTKTLITLPGFSTGLFDRAQRPPSRAPTPWGSWTTHLITSFG